MISRGSSRAEGLARWGNRSLEERVQDRITAILFAADEIRSMIELTPGTTPHPELIDAVESIQALFRPMLSTIQIAAPYAAERDAELEDVLK